MMYDHARDPLIARFGLRPRPGATRVTDAQIEEARAAERHRRRERSRAANEAVDAYMRTSGTRHYPAAFNHIVRTRPDLFAGMQDPSGMLTAANFNFDPYHDSLGRFTTSDAAVAPQGPKLPAAPSPALPRARRIQPRPAPEALRPARATPNKQGDAGTASHRQYQGSRQKQPEPRDVCGRGRLLDDCHDACLDK